MMVIQMKLVQLSLILLLVGCIPFCHGKIDKALLKAIKSAGKADILIDFSGGNSRILTSIASKHFPNKLSKVKALTTGLQGLMTTSQSALSSYLSSRNVQHSSFWSSNQMVVHNADLSLVQAIATFKEVSRVRILPMAKLTPIPSSAIPSAGEGVQWGVAKIQADQVWAQYGVSGEGVIVANIDTGVRGTHEALAANFRADHGWFDPYTGAAAPDDGNGHGTHTMGTIAGAGGIGVAPGAKWIACRGCNSSSCDGEMLLACGDWMLAPTNADGSGKDSSLIPDVVSNSWGGNIGGDTWYNNTIDAWKAAGILHAFANGNSGPLCRSSGSPGDQPTVFAVGSTDTNDKLSSFSSKGPAGPFWASYIKPQISAPGSDVYSTWNTGDNAYNTISGTSMATPHVAGAMALMLSAYRKKAGDSTAKLSFDQVTKTLIQTVDTQGLALGSMNWNCDRTLSRTFPNNQFGYGRLNALKAVNATLTPANATLKAW